MDSDMNKVAITVVTRKKLDTLISCLQSPLSILLRQLATTKLKMQPPDSAHRVYIIILGYLQPLNATSSK